MTDYWFYREECSDFYAQLCADVNLASSNEWKISNYHNDACGSVCFYLDNDTETYVQLHAFMTQEDADLEGLDVYGITVSCNGEAYYQSWSCNSRDEAIQQAALAAVKLRERYEAVLKEEAEEEDDEIETGFEHEGMWITDRTKSPCGRFDLTEEESLKLYGPAPTKGESK